MLTAAALLGILGLTLGGTGLLNLSSEANIQRALNEHGRNADANVIDRFEVQRRDSKGNPNGINYHLTYQFRAGEALVTHTSVVSQELYDQHQAGDSLPIRYLPENTRLSRVVGNHNDSPLRMTLAGLGLLVGAIVCLLLGLRERLRSRRLRRQGVVLHGRLIRARGSWSRAGYHIHIDYIFTKPNGESLLRQAMGVRNDLMNKPMPPGGTQVVVLYVHDGLLFVL